MAELADLPPAAAAECAAVLRRHTDTAWRDVSAADLEWSCWQTALHTVDGVYFYAMQVVYGRPDGYLCTELALDDSASPSRLVDAMTAHAELLHRVVRTADPELRAYHVYGVSDPDGFAAMGVVEMLIHTYDIVRGLDPANPWRPPGEFAAPALNRLFPTAPSGDPADVFLYCCGRAPLRELPRQVEWQWDGRVRP